MLSEMRSRRSSTRALAATVALALSGVLLGTTPAAAIDPNDLNATVTAGDSSDRMSVIGLCGKSAPDAGFCTEVKRSTPGEITIEAGDEATVLLENPASRVRVDVVRRKNRETVEQYPGITQADKVAGWHNRKWKFVLSDLYDATHVLIYVDYDPWVKSDGDEINSATFASRLGQPQ